MPEHLWEGVDGAISEHRTVGEHRAWCFTCSEWCYSKGEHCPCCMEHIGITLDNMIEELREAINIYRPDYYLDPPLHRIPHIIKKYDMSSDE